MAFFIVRPVNGIALNGDEFLLDDSGEPMEFPTAHEAESFLSSHGLAPGLGGIRIEPKGEPV